MSVMYRILITERSLLCRFSSLPSPCISKSTWVGSKLVNSAFVVWKPRCQERGLFALPMPLCSLDLVSPYQLA